jgi:S1-C subfamily serine protease
VGAVSTDTRTTTGNTSTTTQESIATTTLSQKTNTVESLPKKDISLELTLPKLRSANVNLICISNDKRIHSTSGSGTIITSTGVILTAAHVGQFFLLQETLPGSISCSVRTGSPAVKTYTAKPIYVSSSWIQKNKTVLTETAPKGTGEHDFALLAITGNVTGSGVYPYIPLTQSVPVAGARVVVGGYGAEFLSSKRIQQSLFPSLDFSTIKERLTFEKTTVDVISFGANAAAQEGSSGGGVADSTGQLIGVITTSSTNADFRARELRAITLGHIRRSFERDYGGSLDEYVRASDTHALVENYKTKASSLAKILTGAL